MTLPPESPDGTRQPLSRPVWPSVALTDLITPDPVPAVSRRGYMECFYGRRWSPDERLEMVAAAQRLRLNTYVYGPAADERTGGRWREPYDRQSLDHFAALVEHGGDDFEVVWRVSPSAPLDAQRGIILSDPGELATLLTRMTEMRRTGIRGFLLAFDDLSHGLIHAADRDRFGREAHPVAAAQGQLAARVAEHLTRLDAHLVVCPTEYWGVARSDYRRRLSEYLPETVDICWTGRDVVSTSISGDEAALAAQAYGRKVWLWDNYPVNDWDDAVRLDETPHKRLFLGPVEGRQPAVTDHLSAYLVNLCPSPAAALPALASAAAWAWQPQTYRPGAVAAAFWAAADDSGHLAGAAALLSVSPLQRAEHSGLASAVWTYLGAIDSAGDDSGPVDAASAASELQALLSSAVTEVHEARNTANAVAAAADPWFAYVAAHLLAATHSVVILEAHAENDLGALRSGSQSLTQVLTSLAGAPDRYVAGGALHALVERARTVGGTSAPEVNLDAVTSAG